MNDRAAIPAAAAAASAAGDTIAPLREFVVAMTELISRTGTEEQVLREARPLLAALVCDDSWLPEACATADPHSYRQYLLHCDPLERFSVVSFVWGPGQSTPVHDHTVWGMIGMLRGAERCEHFQRDSAGRYVAEGEGHLLSPGEVDLVSPTLGDVHRVSNAHEDQVSISVHVYGANIGAVSRHVFTPDSQEVKPFVSGYSSAQLPNLWDRSSQVRQSLQG